MQVFQRLKEPESEATLWNKPGLVAKDQEEWAEAERCYRQSLAINEDLGNPGGIAQTYNHLGKVAQLAGCPADAERWYRRALEMGELVNPGSPNPFHLNDFADLLVREVQAGRIAPERLAEAKGYARKALAIKETFNNSYIWLILGLLAEIAEMEGQAKEARDYQCRERHTYAAFEANRSLINRLYGPVTSAIPAVAWGETKERELIEKEALPLLEAVGLMIAAATQSIWAGKRDWNALA